MGLEKPILGPVIALKILPFSALWGELSTPKVVEHFGDGRHRQAEGKGVPWRSLRIHRSGHPLLMSVLKKGGTNV
jgi:hypothetical protein